MKPWHKGINFILFLLLWPAAVLGEVNQQLIYMWLLLLAMGVTVCMTSSNMRADFILALLTLLFGLVFESLAGIIGWLSFIDASAAFYHPPIWILVLWLALGLTLRHSNAWLFSKPVKWVLLWLACVPFTYLSAAQLGAVVIDNVILMYVSVFIGWLLMLSGLRWVLNNKGFRTQPQRAHHA